MKNEYDHAAAPSSTGPAVRRRRRGMLALVASAGLVAALAVVVALAVAGGHAASAVASSSPGPTSLVGTVDAFKTAAASGGFTVQEGKLEVFDVAAMYDAGLIPSCWGYNSSAPYLSYKLPNAPGQTAPNNISDAKLEPQNKDLWCDFRLRPDEAIVFIGKTPPECKYFSYRSYIGLRWIEKAKTKNKLRRIFASLGDTTSSVAINTTGTPKGSEGGSPFDQTTVIVTSADKGTAARVKAALVEAGYSDLIVNDDIIPPTLVRMGLLKQSDTFAFLNRVAYIKDQDASDAFFGGNQGTVLRLTPTQQTAPGDLQPQPVPPLKIRGTGNTDEFTLKATLEELRAAIVAKYSKYTPDELDTSIWVGSGYDAIQQNGDALAENRDTTYLRSDDFRLPDDPGQFAIVYGVNHAAFGKVLYSSFGAYSEKTNAGVGAVAGTVLEGTAEAYLPGNPLAKYLYVWRVARSDAGDPNTLVINPGSTAETIGYKDRIFLGFRAYVEPSTKVGPVYEELVYDRVIKFAPRKSGK